MGRLTGWLLMGLLLGRSRMTPVRASGGIGTFMTESSRWDPRSSTILNWATFAYPFAITGNSARATTPKAM